MSAARRMPMLVLLAAPAQALPTGNAELHADAAARFSLAADPAPSAGHDGRFYIRSADGTQRLNLGGYMQFRYAAVLKDSDIPDGEDFTHGFENARTRLIVAGQISDATTFLLLPAVGSSGDWTILDAWARHDFGSGVALSFGQQKLPFFREWTVSERFIQPVERSTITQVFSSLYSQGVQLDLAPSERIALKLAYSDGLRAINTRITAPAEADTGGLTARAEFVPFGSPKVFADITALNTTEPALLLAAAVHWQGETDAFFGTEIDSLIQYTLDLSYETDRGNLLLAFVGRHIDLPSAAAIDREDAFGVLAQGGLFVTETIELFARYSVLIPDPDRAADDPFHEITAGATRYFAGHAAKLTADLVYYPGATTDTEVIGFGPSATTGLLRSEQDSQLALRVQTQIMF